MTPAYDRELCDECLRLDRLCDKHAHLPGTLESFIADQKPAASEDVPSRSRLRRIAAEKGEPAPRFDAREDGLPEEWDTLMPKLYEALADKPIALTYELRDAIRRLAASGQGVEPVRDAQGNAICTCTHGARCPIHATQEKGNG